MQCVCTGSASRLNVQAKQASSVSNAALMLAASGSPERFCVKIPVTNMISGLVQVYGLVSHWNLIHVACHEAARKADSSLRVAKREWEGATLRNAGTLTNNLLPVGSLHPLRSPTANVQLQIAPAKSWCFQSPLASLTSLACTKCTRPSKPESSLLVAGRPHEKASKQQLRQRGICHQR